MNNPALVRWWFSHIDVKLGCQSNSWSRPSHMIIASISKFHVYILWVNACLAKCPNSVFNVKALVGAFYQEKALVGSWINFSTNIHLGLLLQVDPLDLEEVEQGGVLEADVLPGHVTPAGPILRITNVFTTEAMEEIFWWLLCLCY